MTVEAFGVKNLRCLTDTGLVPIKPITLLVGRNSSGKSTFLRAFPLLRQSVENGRKSPILWKHRDFVDYGSIEAAINKGAAEPSVTFDFGFDLSIDDPRTLSMTLASGPDGAYVRAYDITYDRRSVASADIHLEFDANHRALCFTVGGRDALSGRELWLGEAGYLIAPISDSSQGRLVYQPCVGPLHRASSGTDRGKGGGAFSTGTPDRLGAITAEVASELRFLDAEITDVMYDVTYLGPQRSVADRDYLRSEVAVEEVAARGSNLPDFLLSLSPDERQSFAEFTRVALGFETTARAVGIRGEILVKESSADSFVNIADVGFGYAEVLPLCATLWASCVRKPGRTRRQPWLLALEQPELHLHPAHQAKLADIIAGAWRTSRDGGREVKLMVETHSEGLVNRMGELVHDGVVRPSDVQILVFDQDPDTRQTQVRTARYTEEGALNDAWPFGFFAPVAD